MAVVTIVKFILAFAGIVLVFILLVSGLLKKDRNSVKKAAILFVGMWVVLILLTVIEFAFLA